MNQNNPDNFQHGVYQHYKGGKYSTISLFTHSETKEIYVGYISLKNGTTWMRTLQMWQEIIAHNGTSIPRFKFIKPHTDTEND